MPRTIFEILNIEPTADFKRVQKKYNDVLMALQQRLRVPLQAQPHQVKLAELNEAWICVNSEEKLKFFFENKIYLNPIEFGDSENEEVTTIFIPIPIDEKSDKNKENKRDNVFLLSRMKRGVTFQDNFNYSSLVYYINKGRKGQHTIIGSTLDEAEALVRLDSFSHYIIVQVKVPKNLISNKKVDINRLINDQQVDIEKNKHFYCCLKTDSKFTLEDIISIVPGQVLQKKPFTSFKWLWPQMEAEFTTVHNPHAIQKNQFFSSSEILPRLNLDKNKKIIALKSSITAMKDYAQNLINEQDKQGQIKGMFAKSLAKELKEDLDLFILNMDVQQITQNSFSAALVKFKADFTGKLHRHDDVFLEHRIYKNIIIANVLISLTGVGFLFGLLPQMAYSYYKKGRVELFFDTPKSLQKIESAAQDIEELSVDALMVTK